MVALSGNIQEFGVADILQLIGQQAKTGCLALSSDSQEVRVFFSGGLIIHAEKINPDASELLGSRLLRAGLINSDQLRDALAVQRKNLKRIGHIFIELGMVPSSTIQEFSQLQVMEVLYGLFDWHRGTYQFESTSVNGLPQGVEPISTEVVVMNGIRIVDEWPSIRSKISSYQGKIQAVRPYAAGSLNEPSNSSLLLPEQRVMQLVASSPTIQEVIDKSRLGEFETCRVITELAEQGYIRIRAPRKDARPHASWWRRVASVSGHVGVVMISASLAFVAVIAAVHAAAMRRGPPILVLESHTLHQRAASTQRRVLERALEVYRFHYGYYPTRLGQLVEAQIVDQDDLNRPYIEPYEYERVGAGYLLLTPIW